MTDPSKFSCKRCLVAALSTITTDQTANSDVKRAHVAYERGWDRTRVNGSFVVVQFTKSEAGITYGQSMAWCHSMLEAGAKPGTVNVYHSTFDRAWRVVDCGHRDSNGTTTSTPDTGSPVRGVEQQVTTVSTQGPSTPLRDLVRNVVSEPPKRVTSSGGLRLSVAQKNLSLILKWSWINSLISAPPVCPIDRIMLDRASRVTGHGWSVNWTSVDSLEEWDQHFAHLLRAANGMPIAEWEIIQFEGGGEDIQSPRDREMKELLDRILGNESSKPDPVSHEKKVEDAKISFMARFGKGGPGHDEWPYDMLTDALKSSLQHNPTYKETTSGDMRAEIRDAIKRLGLEFLGRWCELSLSEQTVERFREEIVSFRDTLNGLYRPYFR